MTVNMVLSEKNKDFSKEEINVPTNRFGKKNKKWLFVLLGLLVVAVCIYFLLPFVHNPAPKASNTKKTSISYHKADSYIDRSNPESILIRDNPSGFDRMVVVPEYNISFSVPQELSTGQELKSSIHDENNSSTIIR